MYTKKITILGSGNVAFHLCRAFRKSNVPVTQLYSRNREKGRLLAEAVGAAFSESVEALADTDIYILAVSDSAIGEILSRRTWNNRIILHTAGSVPMAILAAHSASHGVFYPLQSFSEQRELDYSIIPFCLEASDNKVMGAIKELAMAVSLHQYEISTDQRLHIHISAVFASNFVNHMYAIAQAVSAGKKIPADLFAPLIRETTAKALECGPVDSQTGPARRKDKAVMDSHIKMLEGHPDWQKIYTFVSESIGNFYT